MEDVKKKTIPQVSIIMGIYNCEDTLEEAIESILRQTFTDWEFIMCDDGSTDQTLEIAQKYSKKYPDKFIVIKNRKNRGLNYTLNHCLKYARGEYIARMDGDDLSLPNRFEEEVRFLDNHSEYAIVSSPMIFFDDQGDWGCSKAIERPQIKDFVNHAPFHCHAPCMIRREAYQAVGGYTIDKKLLRFEDCNLWYKLYAAGYRGYNLQEPLYKMRDDRNAFNRRTPSSRMRGVYVQWKGFRLIKMPLRYYPFLLIEFLKDLMIVLMPEWLYTIMHKKKQRAK
ncbi:glycosyltransferase family 2 protein [Anaerostipes butyraticus]|uniref:glycosyltransferase family 2 protein n=1 Tax=Anaerostipes butyraticus TaxID=645466 RepID=UPI0032081391